MRRCTLAVTAVMLMTITTSAQDEKEKDSKESLAKKDPVGYFLGVSMGQQMSGQGLRSDDFDSDAFLEGLSDGLANEAPKLSNDELLAVQKKLQELVVERRKEMLAKAKEKGDAWLKENLKKEGVKELAGGLQYKVVKAGKGGSPTASDKVRVHYTGKLINGQVFDSSVQRGMPAEFVVQGVIKGWQMALQKMKVGDKWMLYIPSELAYGEAGSRGAIGPNEVLIFEVELLEIL